MIKEPKDRQISFNEYLGDNAKPIQQDVGKNKKESQEQIPSSVQDEEEKYTHWSDKTLPGEQFSPDDSA